MKEQRILDPLGNDGVIIAKGKDKEQIFIIQKATSVKPIEIQEETVRNTPTKRVIDEEAIARSVAKRWRNRFR